MNTSLLVKECEYNNKLNGYELKLYDGRKVQITAIKNPDYSCEPYYPEIEEINNPHLKLTEDELQQIYLFIDWDLDMQEWLSELETLPEYEARMIDSGEVKPEYYSGGWN